MRILVDTDVVSYAYRKDEPFLSFYGPQLSGHTPHVALMTMAELEFGARRRNWGTRRQEELRNFVTLHFVELLPTRETAFLWGRIKAEAEQNGRQVEAADAWIAATALEYTVPLMTNNRRDFEFISGLQLITKAGDS